MLGTVSWKSVFPFLRWWPDVNRKTVKSDLLAGFTGAIVVLPQSVAFALIAGLPPVYGVYTAMVTPVVAALFGSSHQLVSGPTTALSLAVFSTISQFAQPSTESYIALTLLLTFLAGFIQFILGVARMGVLVNFVSHSVIIGFTAGAALLIAASQLKHVLGLHIEAGSSFIVTVGYIASHIEEINVYAVAIGSATLLIALLLRKLFPSVPHLLVVLLLGSTAVYFLNPESLGIYMAEAMPRRLPPVAMISVNYDHLVGLTPQAIAIALLGLIEAVAISRSIATQTHQHLDSSQEFIGQGLSNMIGPFFSCYVGSGSFTRSAVNLTAGAKTPMAAIFAAAILMLIILAVAPLAAYIPMPVMGGIILLVAYNLLDIPHLRQIFRTSRSESAVLLITFISTVFINLVLAIFAGIILSLLFYLMRTSKPKIVMLAPNNISGNRKFMNADLHHLVQCPQLHIIRIDGSLFFGAVDHIKKYLYELSKSKKHILIVATGINFIDMSGAELLVTEAARLKSIGGGLYLSNLKKTARDFLYPEYRKKIGDSNIFSSKEEAISRIYSNLDSSVCHSCKYRIFKECVQ